MNEFKAWLWEVFVELGYSCITIVVVIALLWGAFLFIKFLA